MIISATRRTLRSIAYRLVELLFNQTAKRVEELEFAKLVTIAHATASGQKTIAIRSVVLSSNLIVYLAQEVANA